MTNKLFSEANKPVTVTMIIYYNSLAFSFATVTGHTLAASHKKGKMRLMFFEKKFRV